VDLSADGCVCEEDLCVEDEDELWRFFFEDEEEEDVCGELWRFFFEDEEEEDVCGDLWRFFFEDEEEEDVCGDLWRFFFEDEEEDDSGALCAWCALCDKDEEDVCVSVPFLYNFCLLINQPTDVVVLPVPIL